MKSLIIIPTYNEKGNVERLIHRLVNLSSDIEVLVVDDNSPDGTGEIVSELAKTNHRIHLIQRPRKSGLGPAYIAGFKWGLDRDYDIFFEMDADLSHRPRYIPKFLEGIKHYDVVIGSRWTKEGRIAKWSYRRVLLSRLANLYSKLILQVPIYDLTAGFICYRRKVLEVIDLDQIHSDGYSFQIEMKYRAYRNGFRLFEIPITFTDRKAGDSKISRKIVFEALLTVWFLKLTGYQHKTSEFTTSKS